MKRKPLHLVISVSSTSSSVTTTANRPYFHDCETRHLWNGWHRLRSFSTNSTQQHEVAPSAEPFTSDEHNNDNAVVPHPLALQQDGDPDGNEGPFVILEESYSTLSTSQEQPGANQQEQEQPKQRHRKKGRYNKSRKSIQLSPTIDVTKMEDLFDAIAPHVTLRHPEPPLLDTWMKIVQRNVEQKSTLIAKLTLYDDPDVNGPRYPKWMRNKLLQLFQQHKHTPQMQLAANQEQHQHQKHHGYPPLVNRLDFEKNVNTIIKAREMVFHSFPLEWSRGVLISRITPATTVATSPSSAGESPSNEQDHTTNSDSASSTAITYDLMKRQRVLHVQQRQELHNQKSAETLRVEAEALANHLADHLPVEYHQAVMKLIKMIAKSDTDEDDDVNEVMEGNGRGEDSENDTIGLHNTIGDVVEKDDESTVALSTNSKLLEFFSTTIATSTPTTTPEEATATCNSSLPLIKKKKTNRWKRRRSSQNKIKFFWSRLQPLVKTHFHLVAGPLAEFFYLNHFKDDESGIDIIASDTHVVAARNKWNKAKKRFVKSLVRIHEKLAEQSIDDRPPQGEHDVDENHDEEEKSPENNKSTAETNDDEAKEGKGEGNQLEQTPSSVGQSLPNRLKDFNAVFRDQTWLNWRYPVTFEALVLQESTSNASNVENTLPSVDTSQLNQMVFVDNLPIDIQESEVWDYFSRCGPISDVKIFNRRPDLDPGPLTPKQRHEMLRFRKFPSVAQRTTSRWERPRSPVYGLITFSDPGGCTVALEDSLRIFGMIVRRHAIRTMKATEVTKLYIEGIPPDFGNIVDIEYELSEQLKPDIYICLQLGQRIKKRQSCCEILFPSFESAFAGYHKLQNLEIIDGNCTLNWFRSPWNAPQYWTRQIGFDFS